MEITVGWRDASGVGDDRRGRVYSDDAATGADSVRGAAGQVAGAATDIEHSVALLSAAEADQAVVDATALAKKPDGGSEFVPVRSRDVPAGTVVSMTVWPAE